MNINGLEKLSLDIVSARRADQAEEAGQVAEQSAPAKGQEVKSEATSMLAGLDFAEMGKVHALDQDRVAALIADPLGE